MGGLLLRAYSWLASGDHIGWIKSGSYLLYYCSIWASVFILKVLLHSEGLENPNFRRTWEAQKLLGLQ